MPLNPYLSRKSWLFLIFARHWTLFTFFIDDLLGVTFVRAVILRIAFQIKRILRVASIFFYILKVVVDFKIRTDEVEQAKLFNRLMSL